ncbi:hypothetical protein GIB67_021741 [Kingdonia uniflora]|uniref:beta-ketoacyl-[acyl-carrier-protein] synthase I n=1 Tax=Kingdonia uniflora TaxID=39325 RepID=A0A7J7M9J5_9MAGN|nr:hypothetical protein GIB67_021741 [Kingdonia uniflora]
MSSCLAFEPCEDFNGYYGFSLFGSKTGTGFRKQRRMTKTAAHVGYAFIHASALGALWVGHDPEVFYENLLEGVSGISEIEAFDCSLFPTGIAGEIKSFSTDGWVAPKFSGRMDKFMLYKLTAGKKALADAGISEKIMSEIDKTRCGVLIGSAMGGMKVFNDAIEALRISYRKMNPFCVPFATTNMGSAMLAMDLGWMGPNYSISTACATSNFCILNAANHIIRGEANMMLCGGSDAAIIHIGLGGFVACKAFSQRKGDPTKASRPWDTNRDGFVMGEAAGVLLLEELEHAKRRGANIYAEFLDESFTCDAYHMTEPHPDGAGVILSIKKALAQSGVAREDVNYKNAHATSTQAGGMKEYEALIRCFGKNPELRVNSTKSVIGHLLGAPGAVEAVATVQIIFMLTELVIAIILRKLHKRVFPWCCTLGSLNQISSFTYHVKLRFTANFSNYTILIDPILPPGSVNVATRFLLANTLYFKGVWETKFEKTLTKDSTFDLLDESYVKVPFMTTTVDDPSCHCFEDFKGLRLPYKQCEDSSNLAMYILLPNNRDGLWDLLKKIRFDSEFWKKYAYELSKNSDYYDVGKFRIPKFKISFGFETYEALKEGELDLHFFYDAELDGMAVGKVKVS